MNKRQKKQIREQLERAVEILDEPGSWIKGKTAEISRGRACDYFDPRATRFCALGALAKAKSDEQAYEVHRHARSQVERFIPLRFKLKNLVCFNDDKGTTHLMVKRLFQRAIRDLET